MVGRCHAADSELVVPSLALVARAGLVARLRLRLVAGMGGMPMAGGGAHGNKKAKAVTSAVEAEGNVADLLGAPQRIVPGVIGDWVRG